MPALDRGVQVDLREREFEIRDEDLVSEDGTRFRAIVVWSHRIADPARSVLQVENVQDAVEKAAPMVLRSVVAGRDAFQVLSDQQGLVDEFLAGLRERFTPWGIEVVGANVVELVKKSSRGLARDAKGER
jgi:regulator of protease activity HflC (stomatin/prohibitin superfamily)